MVCVIIRNCSLFSFYLQNLGFRLLILLPTEINGLRILEKDIRKAGFSFSEIFSQLKSRFINLTLPKWKMEQFTEMNDVLKEVLLNFHNMIYVTFLNEKLTYILVNIVFQLGMKTMFDELTADFSEAYAPTVDDKEHLRVGNVVQKAVFEVNENGTEANAVTFGTLRGGGMPPVPPLDITVDRPFIFMVLHKNIILFMGRKSFVKEEL